MSPINKDKKRTAVVVFNQNLRFDDHPALNEACTHERLLPVFIQASEALSPLKQRWQQQALTQLQFRLQQQGSQLFLLTRGQLLALQASQSLTLYQDPPRLIIASEQIHCLAKTYTPFRLWALQKLNNDPVNCLSEPSRWPPLPDWSTQLTPFVAGCVQNELPHTPSLPWIVDEQGALNHWQNYVQAHLNHYKTTRNALMGADFSSKLSLALAQGLISVRRCWQTLMAQTENEHNQWLGYEFLWRDYFHHLWQANTVIDDVATSVDINILTDRIVTACRSHPFAYAMVIELQKTGYLSNRSRQILASFLIYQAHIAWQEGEAFFAYHLLDYDKAINQGNWRYIAGVGADPRGGRIFNLDKQEQQYDADAEYRNYWLGL